MKGGISVNAAVINKNAKLQRVPEACADTNWSRNTLDLLPTYVEHGSRAVCLDTSEIYTFHGKLKKWFELVEVGEDIGIRAKDDVSSSLAARYAKAYSERMSTVNPEFE